MATVIQGLQLSVLQAGQRVKIHGTLAQGATLVACSISMKAPEETTVLEGAIEGLDHHKQTLRIFGIELSVLPNVDIKDRERNPVPLTSIRVGDIAKLKGTCTASRGLEVASIKLQPAESTLLAEVQGNIESVDPLSRTLQAVGLTVVVTDETTINDFPDSAAARKPAPAPTAASDLDQSGESSLELALDECDGRTAASVELGEYMRRPIRGGPRLTRVETDTCAAPGARSSDAFECLIDSLNGDVLAGLARSTTGPAYLLAFVSGSPVRNRLQTARSGWQRLVECLNLDAVARDLERSFDRTAIDRAFSKLRRSTEARLLLTGSRLGPAKLLFRLRGMDDKLLAGTSYNAIERLVDELALLSSDCDEDTRALLRESDLGKSASAVRRRLRVLLRRFDIDETLASSDRAFNEFVRIQQDAGCLHPAMPVTLDAVRGTADALALPPVLSRRVITLFRFAWLCGQERAAGVSDFAIKGLIAIPHDARRDAVEAAEKVLDQTYEVVLNATDHHAGLQRFRDRYPDVRIEVVAQVVAMPTRLFDLFSSLEGPDERRLDFFSRYRLGGEQFANYLAEQRDLTAAARLDFSGHTFDGARRGEVPSLPDDVVFLTAKEGKKRAKRGRVGPFTVSSSRLRAGLERLLASHDDAEVSEWSWRFNEVTKSDLVGRIRGLWSVKAADIR